MSIAKAKTTSRRSQILNPDTRYYILRDTDSRLFIEIKTDGKPFSGVAVERNPYKANPAVKKSLARKLEKAMVALSRKRASCF